MRFLNKINTLLDEMDGAGKDLVQSAEVESDTGDKSAMSQEADGAEQVESDEGSRDEGSHLIPGLGSLQAAIQALAPPSSQQGDTARSALSPSLGDWCVEEGATSGPSTAGGRRSPAPSLGTLSAATSGVGLDAGTHMGDEVNLHVSAMSGSSQWIHAEKESLETISSRSAVGSASGQLEEPSRADDVAHDQSGMELRHADSPSSDSMLHVDAAATAEVESLQHLVRSLEIESAEKQAKLKAASDSLGKSEQKVRELEAQLQHAQSISAAAGQHLEQKVAACQALEKQLEELRKEAGVAKKRAQDQAEKYSEQSINSVKEEMEKELAEIMQKKDEQLKALRVDSEKQEKARKEQSKELDACRRQIEDLTTEVESLHRNGEEFQEEHEKRLETLLEEQRKRAAELEKQRELAERQKHELAINVRGVEERSRSEIARLEAEHSQLTQQLIALQEQLEAEQQKCIDLSSALGDASQRLGPADTSVSAAALEEARSVAELETRELRDRLGIAEEKLLDAQSMRDTFAKETDMYRTELKAAREERKQLEDELARSQEKVRELQAVCGHGDSGVVQQSVIQSMQKEFEERVERYRDEVQYLRQKCEEKAARCEQLLAEKSSLAVQLRNVGVSLDPTGEPSQRDLEAGVKAAKSGRVRGLPVGTPVWLRSTDEAFRMVTRILAANPPARITFFGYVVLMHVWVLFVLQHAAVQ